MKHTIFRPLAIAALLALTLTACGNKEDKKVATQVAAKVGSEEISVHQINQVLSRTNAANATPQAVQNLRREVLEKLIDQQLAVSQAEESKLNRSPEVVAQIEAARREVLARAYIQQITSSLPKPTPEETKKYYVEHPALFSERRVFNLQEVQLPGAAGEAVAEQVRAMLGSGKPMEEVATFLKSKDVKFGGGAATRAAEQIPLELLTKVHALKDGQSLVVKNPQGFNVIRVASSQSAPVPEANAVPRIEQFMANQRGAEAVSQNVKALRTKATVTYMGDFAPGGAGAVQAPGAAASGATAPAAAAAPAQPALAAEAAPAADPAKSQSAIEKGVAKLK
jgi:EpsD family peptidyl-prolyl cis-trans isomerase